MISGIFKFSIAIIISCHKLVTLKNINVFSHTSEGQKSKMVLNELKSKCFQGCVFFSERSGGNLFSCLSASVAACTHETE